VKTSDLFVKCLEAEGVKRIFGVPGEENADSMMSLADSPIEFVLKRQHKESHQHMDVVAMFRPVTNWAAW
jgi:acetolactate synthase-1/2/3 large subunit